MLPLAADVRDQTEGERGRGLDDYATAASAGTVEGPLSARSLRSGFVVSGVGLATAVSTVCRTSTPAFPARTTWSPAPTPPGTNGTATAAASTTTPSASIAAAPKLRSVRLWTSEKTIRKSRSY